MTGDTTGILRALQLQLERVHDVQTMLDVEAYCIGDDVRTSIAGAIDGLDEQLFVRDDGDSLEIALYIAPQVLTRLARDDPRMRLHLGNFEAFCIALEGVSHFVFLAFRAELGRPVTALELELQAEVDKFVVSWLWILQGHADVSITVDTLLVQLFEGFVLREDVPDEQHERYLVASRAAHNICRKLVLQAGPVPDPEAIMQAAQQIFRRGLPEKLQAA